MRGVDDDQIDARLDQREAALIAFVAHGRGGGDAQPAPARPCRPEGSGPTGWCLSASKAGQTAFGIGDQQLLDPALLHQVDGLNPVGGLAQDAKRFSAVMIALTGVRSSLAKRMSRLVMMPTTRPAASTTGKPVTL